MASCPAGWPAAQTQAGLLCGQQRRADDGAAYASFRGVPYAKPPLGRARFKELEPLESWENFYNATVEGPICVQTDILYKQLMQPRGMSEDCIHANIHVPIHALPPPPTFTSSQQPQHPRQTAGVKQAQPEGLPILVFIHGGGFAFGSGDTDLHGPEYMISKNVIVITFNYRLNVFGFLSLNTPEVPGNAGLRDMVTLLRWVRDNARNFGGDPDNVTIAGQSAGSIAAHLLTMSKATEGLFKRAILMSGLSTTGFYSPSPIFAQYMQKQLLTVLNISSTDSEEIYQQLIQLPAENLQAANKFLLDQIGFTTFVPTVEGSYPGIIPIVDDYPDVLLATGRGKDIPLLIGYTSNECETFRGRLEEFDFVGKVKQNPFTIVPPKLLFMTLPEMLPAIAKKINMRYYKGTISVDGFVKSCTDGFYEYPTIKLAEGRGNAGEVPVYIYKFSYDSKNSILRQVQNAEYSGGAHVEDLMYVFKTNSVIGSHTSYYSGKDENMKNFMTTLFVDFMTHSKPHDLTWCAAPNGQFLYEEIREPTVTQVKHITERQREITKFFDTLTTAE